MSILYFAWVKERIGTGEETFALPDEVTTVGALVAALRGRGAGYLSAFAPENLVRAAVNQDFATPGTPVRAGDEVAFFPPVTGG